MTFIDDPNVWKLYIIVPVYVLLVIAIVYFGRKATKG